jgi:hypothetical protein
MKQVASKATQQGMVIEGSLACSVTNHVNNVKYIALRTYPRPTNQVMIRESIWWQC